MSKAAFSVLELGSPAGRGERLHFLGGFPDDHMSGWSPLYEIMKHKYSILSLCLPQFHQRQQQQKGGNGNYKKWGYSFDELVLMLHEILCRPLAIPSATNDLNGQQETPSSPSVTLICHDWGAVIGLLYCNKYPQNVKRLILIDVGIKSISETSFWETFLIILYQWWFSIAYIIGQFFGSPLGNCIFVTYMILVTIFPFLKVCPRDTFHRPASEMTIEMCYLYFHYWKLMLQGRPIQLKMPTCPVLYMYGTQKNAMFHGPSFLQKLSEDKRCRTVAFDSGHYPMHSHPQDMADVIESFLHDSAELREGS